MEEDERTMTTLYTGTLVFFGLLASGLIFRPERLLERWV